MKSIFLESQRNIMERTSIFGFQNSIFKLFDMEQKCKAEPLSKLENSLETRSSWDSQRRRKVCTYFASVSLYEEHLEVQTFGPIFWVMNNNVDLMEAEIILQHLCLQTCWATLVFWKYFSQIPLSIHTLLITICKAINW